MGNRVLCIEIGQSLTRVVELDYKSKNPKIYNMFSFATPKSMMTDGVIDNGVAFKSILADKIKQYHVGTNKAVFILNSTRIASREIEIPNVKENKIKELLATNASDYFPVNLEQYQLVHEILEKFEDGDEKKIKLSVLAIPKEIIKSYELLADSCDLTLTGLDYIGNSIKQLMIKEIPDKVKVTVKVDDAMSVLTIMNGETVTLQRLLNYGIADAIEEIQDSGIFGGCESFDDAMNIARKRNCMFTRFDQMTGGDSEKDISGAEIDSVKLSQIRARVTDNLQTLIGSISRVLDYYQSRNIDHVIESIYLIGLGADFKGFDNLMSNEINFNIVPIKEYKNVTLSKNIVLDSGSIAEYFTCIGASLNTLPIHVAEKKIKKIVKGDDNAPVEQQSYTVPLIVCAGCVVASVIMIAYSFLTTMNLRKQNDSLQEQINEISYAEEISIEYNKVLGEYNWITAMDDLTYGPNKELNSFIDELEEKMPSKIKVKSLSANSTSVSMTIEVDKKETVAKVISQLRTFKSIDVYQISSINEEKHDDGSGNLVEFTVDCNYTISAITGKEDTSDDEASEEAAPEDMEQSDDDSVE